MEKIRKAIPRSRPYGSEKWVGRAVAEVGLEKHHAQPRASEKGTKQRYLTPFLLVAKCVSRREGDSHRSESCSG
jgi:hypothetical protein